MQRDGGTPLATRLPFLGRLLAMTPVIPDSRLSNSLLHLSGVNSFFFRSGSPTWHEYVPAFLGTGAFGVPLASFLTTWESILVFAASIGGMTLGRGDHANNGPPF